jgi:hypothetical protein
MQSLQGRDEFVVAQSGVGEWRREQMWAHTSPLKRMELAAAWKPFSGGALNRNELLRLLTNADITNADKRDARRLFSLLPGKRNRSSRHKNGLLITGLDTGLSSSAAAHTCQGALSSPDSVTLLLNRGTSSLAGHTLAATVAGRFAGCIMMAALRGPLTVASATRLPERPLACASASTQPLR